MTTRKWSQLRTGGVSFKLDPIQRLVHIWIFYDKWGWSWLIWFASVKEGLALERYLWFYKQKKNMGGLLVLRLRSSATTDRSPRFEDVNKPPRSNSSLCANYQHQEASVGFKCFPCISFHRCTQYRTLYVNTFRGSFKEEDEEDEGSPWVKVQSGSGKVI